MYDMSGRNIIMKKKNTVRSRIDMIILFSVIRCIKYPATREAFTEAIMSAKKMPSDVLTSRYDASTVMTVKTASAPKTIRYTLICSWIDSLL